MLQEASDTSVPLIQRIHFLGIYSSNMDEFFETRVATLKRLSALGKRGTRLYGADPALVLAETQRTVMEHQKQYEAIYRSIISDLEKRNAFFVDETMLGEEQILFVESLLKEKVRPHIFPVILNRGVKMPDLEDRGVFLMIELVSANPKKNVLYSIIEIPSDEMERFVLLPCKPGTSSIIMLDDVIRFGLPEIFSSGGFSGFRAFDFKITRDAELDLGDDLSESLPEKINKSVRKRKTGRPVRLSYDELMPKEMLAFLLKKLKFRTEDTVIPGARYHNFRDFKNFPDVLDEKILVYPAQIQHPALAGKRSIFDVIRKQDVMLHYPYHSFNHMIDLLREASLDPKVRSVKITLYRVAKNSGIVNALINAVRNGKTVTVLLELQARFDEINNIDSAKRLREEGASVIFGIPGLKVHSKLILVEGRGRAGQTERYCAIATGNFNEDTAWLYTDDCLLTSNKIITEDAHKLFQLFENVYQRYDFKSLKVSPYSLRSTLEHRILKETENAKAGTQAYIDVKVNNLSDQAIAKLLYKASAAGVKIRLIVRSMFSLVPGIAGLSENIEARSIVDKYLEHSRVFFFCNGGEEKCFISSADLLPRNLDKRIEIACPIVAVDLRLELRDMFELAWEDNVKSRIVDATQKNEYNQAGTRKIRCQEKIYEYLKAKSRS